MVSLQSPSAVWAGVLVPAEQLKDTHQVVLCIPWEEPGLCLNAELLFLDHLSFLSAFPPYLISNCLNLLFGAQEKPRRLKPFFYKKETGHTEAFVPGKAPQDPALFQSPPPFL